MDPLFSLKSNMQEFRRIVRDMEPEHRAIFLQGLGARLYTEPKLVDIPGPWGVYIARALRLVMFTRVQREGVDQIFEGIEPPVLVMRTEPEPAHRWRNRAEVRKFERANAITVFCEHHADAGMVLRRASDATDKRFHPDDPALVAWVANALGFREGEDL